MTKSPPIKKQIVATSEGHCKFEMPIIEWPEVQPLAQRVPKPTKKPPKTMKTKPLNVKSWSNEKMSAGNRPVKSLIPSASKSDFVLLAN